MPLLRASQLSLNISLVVYAGVYHYIEHKVRKWQLTHLYFHYRSYKRCGVRRPTMLLYGGNTNEKKRQSYSRRNIKRKIKGRIFFKIYRVEKERKG